MRGMKSMSNHSWHRIGTGCALLSGAVRLEGAPRPCFLRGNGRKHCHGPYLKIEMPLWLGMLLTARVGYSTCECSAAGGSCAVRQRTSRAMHGYSVHLGASSYRSIAGDGAGWIWMPESWASLQCVDGPDTWVGFNSWLCNGHSLQQSLQHPCRHVCRCSTAGMVAA